MKKLTKVLLACAIGFTMAFSSYGQETVYVIANLNVNPNPINAYGVLGSTLITPPVIQSVPDVGGGAVGLAMDEANGVLFVCYEATTTMNMINATNMTYIGSITSGYNMSGIAYDPVLSKLYATRRGTNELYSYTWDPVLQTLTNDFSPAAFVNLPGLTSCYDIAFDHINGILYCGDLTTSAIKYYNVGVWGTLAGSYTVGHPPIGVDIDITNQIIYSSAGWGGYTLSKYVIGTGETMFTLASTPMGVAVNQSSGYVYLTTRYGSLFDRLLVMDPLNGNITWNSVDIGDPTAVLYTGVGYNPLGLSKTVVPTCFTLGQNLTYTISYSNGNPGGVTGVIVTDTLPANTTFVSATGTPTVVGNVVTWNVGALAPGVGGSFTLVATVNSGTVVDNIATINSNETGVVLVTLQTPVCIGPVVPLADWAIYIVIVLIGVAVWFRFRK